MSELLEQLLYGVLFVLILLGLIVVICTITILPWYALAWLSSALLGGQNDCHVDPLCGLEPWERNVVLDAARDFNVDPRTARWLVENVDPKVLFEMSVWRKCLRQNTLH